MKNRHKLRPTRAQKIAASRAEKRDSKYAKKAGRGVEPSNVSKLAEGLQRMLGNSREESEDAFPEAK